MVTNVTSLSRTGLADWVVQRISAVVLASYTLFLLGWLVCNPFDYNHWHALFEQTWLRIFSLLALLALGGHAWVGVWTIVGDYLNERALGRKALAVRLIVQSLCATTLFVYMVWGVQILWGA